MKANGKYIDFYSDKTTVLRYVALSFAFILVIALSFGAKFFLQTEFDSADFWGDFGLSAALCVYCLFIGMPEAKDAYRKKREGRYQTCMSEFRAVRGRVMPRDADFDEWLEVFYKEQKLDYYHQILTVNGITEYKVLDLDISEVEKLSQPYHKEWESGAVTDFKTMTPDQIKVIERILRGKIKVKKIPNDAFKTTNGKIIANEYVSQSKQEGRDNMTYVGLIISRLVLMLAISFLLAIFGVELAKAEDAEQVLNQVIDTISRIWTMLSSYMYGFSIGRMMVTNECNRIEFKTRVNIRFESQSGTYPVATI